MKVNPVVTLLSDWHNQDYYVASIKGRILTHCPTAQIIDISHQVSTFNIAQAALILRNTYHHFPAGSIHLIAVNAITPTSAFVAIKYDNHIFLSADNGIFSLLFEKTPEKIILLIPSGQAGEIIFPELYILAETAGKLLSGISIDSLGETTTKLNSVLPLRPNIEESLIIGNIIYIDSYQNAITNITRDTFEKIGKGRPFEIVVNNNKNKITTLSSKYTDAPDYMLLALFNSTGLLEIAINKGFVAKLFSLDLNAVVRIKFLN